MPRVKRETLFCVRVQNDLKKLSLGNHHVWFKKTQEVSRRGMPDIIGSLDGRFIALELKTDDGVVDKLQQVTIDRLAKTGAYARVVRESEWTEVLEELKNL